VSAKAAMGLRATCLKFLIQGLEVRKRRLRLAKGARALVHGASDAATVTRTLYCSSFPLRLPFSVQLGEPMRQA